MHSERMQNNVNNYSSTECLQIQPNQFPGDIQDTFFNSRRFLRDKPYNIKMHVKFVMSDDLLTFTGQGC